MKKVKAKHRHSWVVEIDSCNACGAHERYCKICDITQLLDGKDKVIDETN